MYFNSSIKEDITGSIEIENPMKKYLPLKDEFPLNTDYLKYYNTPQIQTKVGSKLS